MQALLSKPWPVPLWFLRSLLTPQTLSISLDHSSKYLTLRLRFRSEQDLELQGSRSQLRRNRKRHPKHLPYESWTIDPPVRRCERCPNSRLEEVGSPIFGSATFLSTILPSLIFNVLGDFTEQWVSTVKTSCS